MPHPDSEGHTAGYLGYTSALSCLIVKDRDALLQATDALLSALAMSTLGMSSLATSSLAMSSLVMPACCKAVMLGVMGEDVGLACRVEAPQSSVHKPIHSKTRTSKPHMRMSGQVNDYDPAACEALPEEMSNAEHVTLEEQRIRLACSFPQSLELAANPWGKTLPAQRTKEPATALPIVH
jgi:hypothetical protein